MQFLLLRLSLLYEHTYLPSKIDINVTLNRESLSFYLKKEVEEATRYLHFTKVAILGLLQLWVPRGEQHNVPGGHQADGRTISR